MDEVIQDLENKEELMRKGQNPNPEPSESLKGVPAIKHALKSIPGSPGVYRMLNAKGEVLYVGKAKSLKKRVTSYTRLSGLADRIRRMVSETTSMEIIITYTEAEALLLEANLIRHFKPKFNILLRDDKTYPWLTMTTGDWPRIDKHRGKVDKKNLYWGPFASVWAVNQTLELIQRTFLLRTCTDAELESRSRPCLLYQIKRCSGPCDDRISKEEYAELAKQAQQFLSGQNFDIQQQLAVEMEAAAERLDFERAAMIRDRIRGFAYVQKTGIANPASVGDADVIAIYQAGGQCCIQVFFIRNGRNNGNRAFFPSQADEETAEDIVTAFLGQFYENKVPPEQILLNCNLPESKVLNEALSLRSEHKVKLFCPQKGEKKEVVDHATLNAKEALERHMAESSSQKKLLKDVGKLFKLPKTPERIEIYDNSHIMGTHPYGVMVVAGPEGFIRSAYRKFGIKSAITPGDDFGMMREVLERRFAKTLQLPENERNWPDILLIDGGVGQFSAVKSVLDELQVTGVKLVAIAKGRDRNAGREWFHTDDQPPFQLPERDPVLYYLQRLRDESHRFAITTHRSGRAKTLVKSELDEIPGIGGARKRILLNHFGSARAVKDAGLKELTSVAGISRSLAFTIYGHFRPDWIDKEN